MRKIKNVMLFIAAVLCFVIAAATVASAESGCDHSWSIADTRGKACTGYRYIYACSKCLAQREETTAPTQPHSWMETYSQTASCTEYGVLMAVCTLCGELKKEITPAYGHDYVYASNNNATCTRDGTSIRTCKICGDRNIVVDVGSALGHKYSDEWIVVEPSTCLEKGVSKHICARCDAEEYRYDDLGAHTDKDRDYTCDLCGERLSIFTPVAPDNDDSDSKEEDCSCNCHKGGIKGFFWKIGNFFAKLFRVKSKQICSCGVYHF